MEIQYFANITIKSPRHLFPLSKTIEIDSPDIDKIKLPKNAIKVETFYKIFDFVEHDGNIYPTSTDPIDKKTYHIGKLLSDEEYPSKSEYIAKLKDLGLIKGVVATSFGESVMLEGENVINPNSITKEGFILKSASKQKVSAVSEDKVTEEEK